MSCAKPGVVAASAYASDLSITHFGSFTQQAHGRWRSRAPAASRGWVGLSMAILNYTTSVSAEKTVGEIQAKLAKAKATAVLCEYDSAGVISHVAFRIETPHGLMAFRLPANIDGVLRAMQKDQKVPRSSKTREQAARVAWRIVKDWVEAQLAIIEAEMATLAEVFLPYAQTPTGETVYQRFEKHGIAALTHNPEAA